MITIEKDRQQWAVINTVTISSRIILHVSDSSVFLTVHSQDYNYDDEFKPRKGNWGATGSTASASLMLLWQSPSSSARLPPHVLPSSQNPLSESQP